MITRILLIALGGALGTLSRYGIGVWAGRALGTAFPYGTLIVNVAGCFLIALVAELAAASIISPTMRLTLMTGFMGGLTTYSSFNFETTGLLGTKSWAAGFGNLGITLVGCFTAGLLGLALARKIVGH